MGAEAPRKPRCLKLTDLGESPSVRRLSLTKRVFILGYGTGLIYYGFGPTVKKIYTIVEINLMKYALQTGGDWVRVEAGRARRSARAAGGSRHSCERRALHSIPAYGAVTRSFEVRDDDGWVQSTPIITLEALMMA